jgi:diguanylate cyclase (GGDEF)-like protein
MDVIHKDKVDQIQLIEIFNFMIKIIANIANEVDHFNEIKNLINYIYDVKSWSILRLDETTNQLFFTILESDSEEVLKQIPIKLGEGICGEVARTGVPQIITQVHDSKNKFTKSIDAITGFNTQNIVAVPILYSGKVLGVLELVNVKNPDIFNTDYNQLILLQTIANFIGVIFTVSSTHHEIVISSERDILTGVHNRVYLKKILDSLDVECHLLRKGDINELLVVMIDLNDFKKVNDNLGHLAGDFVLKETAKLLTYYFRKEDLIIRYGGDEFMILIDTQQMEENFQDIVKDKLEKISSSLPHQCSLAFGISSGEKIYFGQIMHEADKLMYEDKFRKKHL